MHEGGLSSFTIFNMVAAFVRHAALHRKHFMHAMRATRPASQPGKNARGGADAVGYDATGRREGAASGDVQRRGRVPALLTLEHSLHAAWVTGVAKAAAWEERPRAASREAYQRIEHQGGSGDEAGARSEAQLTAVAPTFALARDETVDATLQQEWRSLEHGADLGDLLISLLRVRALASLAMRLQTRHL